MNKIKQPLKQLSSTKQTKKNLRVRTGIRAGKDGSPPPPPTHPYLKVKTLKSA